MPTAERVSEAYLIWSHEHGAWWGPGRNGYVLQLCQAGRYSRQAAMEICTRAMPGTSTRIGALPELPVRLADVEALTAAYKTRFPDRNEPWE